MKPLRGLSFDGMVVALLFVAVGLGACLTVAQSDTFWNLRAGQEIWRTGHVPTVDTYSYTAAGRLWPDHEWLWQALTYPIYRVGGFQLLTAVAATMIIAATALVYQLMVGAVSTRFVLIALAVPVSSVVWSLRPQLVTLLALTVLLSLLVADRARWLPVLFLIWANAHGGVALGGVVLVVAWLVALFRARRVGATDADRGRVWRLGMALPLCALVTAATPLGFGIFRFVVTSEARLREAQIVEWMPLSMGVGPLVAFWALGVTFLVLLAWRWRRLRDAAWSDWVCVAVVLALLPFALRSARHVGVWLLLAPVAASRLLGAEFRWRRRPAPTSTDNPRLNALILALVGGAAVLTVALAWSMPLPRLGWDPLPGGVLAAVRACPERLYNHYNQGGFLVWLVPERRVFIDSRQDPYPISFLLEHQRVEAGQQPPLPLFERWGIHCSFLEAKSPTVASLARAGWRTTFSDSNWTVQVAP